MPFCAMQNTELTLSSILYIIVDVWHIYEETCTSAVLTQFTLDTHNLIHIIPYIYPL